jgi:hypothetical protein
MLASDKFDESSPEFLYHVYAPNIYRWWQYSRTYKVNFSASALRQEGTCYYEWSVWRSGRFTRGFDKEPIWMWWQSLATCLHAGFLLGLISTLKMEAICSSETSVDTQRTTQRYILKDGTLQQLDIFRGLISLSQVHISLHNLKSLPAEFCTPGNNVDRARFIPHHNNFEGFCIRCWCPLIRVVVNSAHDRQYWKKHRCSSKARKRRFCASLFIVLE